MHNPHYSRVNLLILSPTEGRVTPVVPEAPRLWKDSWMTEQHLTCHLTELMMRPGKDGRNWREDSGTPETFVVRLNWQVPLLLREVRGAPRLAKPAAVVFLWFCQFREVPQSISLSFLICTCPVQGSPCDVFQRSGKRLTPGTTGAWSGRGTFPKVKHVQHKIEQLQLVILKSFSSTKIMIIDHLSNFQLYRVLIYILRISPLFTN